MEILTLLKANIRRKKGTFISILLLTAIVMAMTASIFSVKKNYQSAMETAFKESDCGDIFSVVRPVNYSDELWKKLENSSLVDRVEYYEAVVSAKIMTEKHSFDNAQFLIKMRDEIRLFNKDLSGFEDKSPKLQSGEVYLPLGLKSTLECDIGDTLTFEFTSGETEQWSVKGFVQEPACGSMYIGIKQIFISDEDHHRLYEKTISLAPEENKANAVIMNIFQAEDSGLSSAKFQRKLNLETKFSDLSWLTLNKEQSTRYSSLMPDIVLDIVLAFVVFLFAIILIIMSHSISTEIEIDYVTLGIMKSQGFTKGKIRLLFLLQYLLAQTLGVVVGIAISLPIERLIGSIFQIVTGFLHYHGISAVNCLIVTASILIISALIIIIRTRKIANISPVRAISGGRNEIYFDSRLRAPIFKKALSPSLSLRQFTSAKMRYIGTIFIAALLTFSMITVNLIGVLLDSDKALRAMGLELSDILIFSVIDESKIDWEEADKLVEAYSPVESKNSTLNGYASLDGENLYFQTYEYPEYLNTHKGRTPNYDNEIVITEMVADMLEIGMGDEITVSYGNKDDRFIVSGIFQSGSDSGMTFAMSFEGAERIGIDTSRCWRSYVLEDKSKANEISDKLRESYGEGLKMILDSESNPISAEYDLIVSVIQAIIYSFSLIFAFIVVGMVCTRTFTQERRDIGIFKAVGFTSFRLRFSFAVRFIIVAAIGAVSGIVMSILLAAKMLGTILSLIGISHVVLEFTLGTVTIPFLTICLGFAVFAFAASWRIRTVAVRELVIE